MRSKVFLLPVQRFPILIGKTVNRLELKALEQSTPTRGGVSKAAWRSRMRLVEPLTRNVPSTSVADKG